jgi:hydrogenase-4 membrane subunit HyfE
MNNNMLAAYLAIAAAVTLGRLVTERGRRSLSSEQKLDLLDRFSPLRKYAMIPMIVFILVVYKRPFSWLIWGFAAIVVATYCLRWILIRRVPVTDIYLRGSTVELCIAFAGAVAFVLIAFWPALRS